MAANLENVIAAKARRASLPDAEPPHWRRETSTDATRYGSYFYVLPGGDHDIVIEEGYASTGTRVWDAAVACARLFEHHRRVEGPLAVQPGESVLELGAGSGLLALALAAQGADVVATEIPQVVDHLQNCVASNARAVAAHARAVNDTWRGAGPPLVGALDWSDPDAARRFGGRDVVVASDVLICQQWAEALAGCLAVVADTARLVLVATQRRRDGVPYFLTAVAAAGFAVEELGRDSFHPDFWHEDLQLFRLQWEGHNA